MTPSLCESCRNVREVRTARSRLLLCEVSVTNENYPKYPQQPVVRCQGYEAKEVLIRPETSADHEAIRMVNRLAFGQDAETRLVDALREGCYVRLSLVAESDGQIVGHILFSDLPILAEAGTVASLSLAPMAVLPAYQRQGTGSALVRRGLEVCRDQAIESLLCWDTRTSTHDSGSQRSWPGRCPHPSAVQHGWRWSWCRGR